MEIIKSAFHLLIFVKCVQISESTWSAEGRIGIRFYTEGPTTYIEEPLESGAEVFSNNHYNRYLPVVFLIHGMGATVDCEFVEGSVKAMYFRGVNKMFNIVALNLPELIAKQSVVDKFVYTTALNSKIAGKAFGDFLNDVINKKLISPAKIYLVGYSMGAQVAGYTARQVKEAHGLIRFIMGLDPAGIGFTPNTLAAWYTGLVHVSAADAEHVHFIHCNSIGWGTAYYNATANFIFNGGYFQPGCATSKDFGCSHTRVPFYFIESILFPEKFLAQKCESWNSFTSCHCSSEETRKVTFPPDLGASGSYYLRTKAETLFGQGEAGIKCSEESKIVAKDDDKLRNGKVQKTRKYVKKEHKNVHHMQSQKSSPKYQHRTIDDYERMQDKTSSEHHSHKTETFVQDIKSQTKTTMESDSSIDDILEKIHHNIVQ